MFSQISDLFRLRIVTRHIRDFLNKRSPVRVKTGQKLWFLSQEGASPPTNVVGNKGGFLSMLGWTFSKKFGQKMFKGVASIAASVLWRVTNMNQNMGDSLIELKSRHGSILKTHGEKRVVGMLAAWTGEGANEKIGEMSRKTFEGFAPEIIPIGVVVNTR